ncbi:MAG: hypothetical protein ACOC5T_02300 [Elusimicrobiota bacterium]
MKKNNQKDLCKICNKELGEDFVTLKGYKYCSTDCAYKDKAVMEL